MTGLSKDAIDEAVSYEVTKMQRFAAARKASQRMQEAAGIPPGARMMGNRTVQVWELPQKPKTWQQIVQEFQGGVVQKKEEGQGSSEVGDEVTPVQKGYVEVPTIGIHGAEEEEGESQVEQKQYEVNDTPHRSLTRKVKKRDDSPQRSTLHQKALDLPDTILEAGESPAPNTIIADETTKFKSKKGKETASPGTQLLLPSPKVDTRRQGKIFQLPSNLPKDEDEDEDAETGANELTEDLSNMQISPVKPEASSSTPSLFPPIPGSVQPASPPFNFAPAKQDRHPLYWDWMLSRRVNDWLDDETTKSTQTDLTHIELRSADGAVQIPRYTDQDFEKLKLTRLTISPEAETERFQNPAIRGPPEQRDWFIFEVQCKNKVLAQMELDEDGMPLEEPDDDDPDDFPEDYWLLAFPVCAVQDTKSTSADMGEGRVLQTTTWTVGKVNFVPSMHGRGVQERFATGFIEACAQEKGVIEFAGVY